MVHQSEKRAGSERRGERLLALSRVALRVQESLEAKDVFPILGEELRGIGLDCAILLLDEQGKEFELPYFSLSSELAAAFKELPPLDTARLRVPIETAHIASRTVNTRKAVFTTRLVEAVVRVFPPESAALVSQTLEKLPGLKAAIAAPLMSRGQAFGALVVWSADLSEEDLPAVALLANQVATGVDNARLYQEAQHRVHLAAKLAEISALASSTPELTALLDQVMGRIVELVEAEIGAFMLYEPESGELVAQYTGSFGATWEQVSRLRVKVDGPGIGAQVFRTGEAIISNDAPNDPRLLQEFIKLFGVRQAITIPLRVGNRGIGVMHIANKSNGAFTQEDVDLLTTAAGHCAAAIENARLLQESRRRAEKLAALHRLSMVINSSLSLSEVYKAFIQELQTLVLFDRAGMFLADRAGGYIQMVALAMDGELRPPERKPLPLKGSALEKMMHDGQPIINDDLEKGPFFPGNQNLLEEGMRSLIRLPIRAKGQVLGCFSLGSRELNRYSQKDLEILEPVAEQLALALEKERLFQTVQELERHHREALDMAGDAILQLDREGRFTYVNAALERLAGASSAQLLGRRLWNWIERFPEARDQARLRQEFASLLGTGQPSTHQVKVTTGQGEERWIEIHATPIRREGQIVGVEGVIRDITDRKRAQEALEKSEGRYRELFEGIQDAVVVFGSTGRFLDCNEATLERLGYSRQEFLRLNPADIVHPEFHSVMRENQKRIWAGEATVIESVHRAKDGRMIPVEVSARRIDYGEEEAILAVVRDITERKRAEEALRKAALETLFAVSTVTEARDPYTGGHSQRVTEYALGIARRLNLPEAELETLRIAGLLHDVGKVAIPDAVLNKPGRLSRSEWLVIYAHPTISASVAENVAAFQRAVPAIRHHHELWDGTGYPAGLKGEEIPLLSRLLTVPDWYEAMTSDRPYRNALTKEEALEELRRNAGRKLDPKVVEAFLQLIAEGLFQERPFGG